MTLIESNNIIDTKIKKERKKKKELPNFITPITLFPLNNKLFPITEELKNITQIPISNKYRSRKWRKSIPKYIEPFMNIIIYSFDKINFYFSGLNIYKFPNEVINLVIHENKAFFILKECFYKYEDNKFIKYPKQIKHLCINILNELVLIKEKTIYFKDYELKLEINSNIKNIYPTTNRMKYYLILENNNIIYLEDEIYFLFEISSPIRIQSINNNLIILTDDGLYIYYGDQKRGNFIKKNYLINSNTNLLFTANEDYIFINKLGSNNLIIFLINDLSKYNTFYFIPSILNIVILKNKIYLLFYNTTYTYKLYSNNNNDKEIKEGDFFNGLFDPLNNKKYLNCFNFSKKKQKFILKPLSMKSNMFMKSPLINYFNEIDSLKNNNNKIIIKDNKIITFLNINKLFYKYFKEELIIKREFIDENIQQKEIKETIKKKVIKRKSGFFNK